MFAIYISREGTQPAHRALTIRMARFLKHSWDLYAPAPPRSSEVLLRPPCATRPTLEYSSCFMSTLNRYCVSCSASASFRLSNSFVDSICVIRHARLAYWGNISFAFTVYRRCSKLAFGCVCWRTRNARNATVRCTQDKDASPLRDKISRCA